MFMLAIGAQIIDRLFKRNYTGHYPEYEKNHRPRTPYKTVKGKTQPKRCADTKKREKRL